MQFIIKEILIVDKNINCFIQIVFLTLLPYNVSKLKIINRFHPPLRGAAFDSKGDKIYNIIFFN